MNLSEVTALSDRVRPHLNFGWDTLSDSVVLIFSGLILWCFQLHLDWFGFLFCLGFIPNSAYFLKLFFVGCLHVAG